MSFTTREIFGMFLVLLVGLFSVASFSAFFTAILHPDFPAIFRTVVWISLLGTTFFLGMVVWKELILQIMGVFSLALPSLLFVHTSYYIEFVIFSMLLIFWGVWRVQGEIQDHIQFHFFRNVRSGSLGFIFGLSLILASAYFTSIQKESWEELVPRFSLGEGTTTVVFKAVAYLYPAWKNLANEGMTVDGFLLSLEQEQWSSDALVIDTRNIPSNEALAMTPLGDYLKQAGLDGRVLSRDLYLRSGRDQIALLVGKPVQGDEKIADVFSLAIQHKILTALNGEEASRHISPTIVPVILALLLFLTLLPVGSAIALLWIFFSFLGFRSALFFGWITLGHLEREQEVLAP